MSRLRKELLGLFVLFRERGDGSMGPPMQAEKFHGPDGTFREMVSMFTALLKTHILFNSFIWASSHRIPPMRNSHPLPQRKPVLNRYAPGPHGLFGTVGLSDEGRPTGSEKDT